MSKILVNELAHTNNTTALTVASDGEVSFSQPYAVNPKLNGSAVSLNTLSHKDFTIPAGMTIYGSFEYFSLASGKVIAYKG